MITCSWFSWTADIPHRCNSRVLKSHHSLYLCWCNLEKNWKKLNSTIPDYFEVLLWKTSRKQVSNLWCPSWHMTLVEGITASWTASWNIFSWKLPQTRLVQLNEIALKKTNQVNKYMTNDNILYINSSS